MKPTPTCADVGVMLNPLVDAWHEECMRHADKAIASMPAPGCAADVEFKALVSRVRTLNALIDAARLILTELRNKPTELK